MRQMRQIFFYREGYDGDYLFISQPFSVKRWSVLSVLKVCLEPVNVRWEDFASYKCSLRRPCLLIIWCMNESRWLNESVKQINQTMSISAHEPTKI